MDTNMIIGILCRHGLTVFGGYLIGQGYMSQQEVDAFVGGGVVVAGILISYWSKKHLRGTENGKK